ncbi:MAG: glycosyltransferase [bacterium]
MTQKFSSSSRPHILMVTNHGIHDWEVRSGLTDTGGQNHYVNALSDTLAALGYKVTTFNRGGFPDPVTNEMRTGARYKDENSRIVYLEGGGHNFIRKEDLDRTILEQEAGFAERILKEEGAPVDLIISHYWDGALLADLVKGHLQLAARHVWIPHSLGALKKENFKHKPADVIAACRFDERIAYEKELLPRVDAVASTSSDISRVLHDSYGRTAELTLPPCINTDEVHPMEPSDCKRIYDFLDRASPGAGKRVRGRPCVLEVSRTDRTKRKDVVIKAFAGSLKENPEAMLLLTLSPDNKVVYDECMQLIESAGIRDRVVLLGMIPRNIMSELYAITTVYCSPSEMEGFGMSVQEAAACRRALVASDLVPFAVEYLQKDATEEKVPGKPASAVRWGAGAVVKAGDVEGFTAAVTRLLRDEPFRTRVAAAAYGITIPYFTWPRQTRRLLSEMGMTSPVDIH